MADEKVKAVLILEIIGRPKEHLIESLNKITDEMGQEKGVTVLSRDIKEPVELKDNDEFFTTFGEIEVEVDDPLYVAMLMFKYMPAHVEIVSPEEIVLSNNGYGEILSELTRRLHSYDEVSRVLQFEKAQLLKKIRMMEGEEPEKKESKKK